MRALVLVLIASVASACAEDVDLTGVYVVDSDVMSNPCGADEPEPDAPAYLRFQKGELFGSPYFAYFACVDEAGSDCASIGGLFDGFYEPIDDGWQGRTSTASGNAADCALGYSLQTAILGGNQLVVESSSYADRLAVGSCTPEEAERRGAEMPCLQHERIQATKL
jgi:hypothetical protein